MYDPLGQGLFSLFSLCLFLDVYSYLRTLSSRFIIFFHFVPCIGSVSTGSLVLCPLSPSIFHASSSPSRVVFLYSLPFFEISICLALSFLHTRSRLFFALFFFDFAFFSFVFSFLPSFLRYFVTLGNRLPCIKATASSGFFALVSTDLYLPPAWFPLDPAPNWKYAS